MYALLTAHRVCMLYYRWKKAAPLVFISFVYSHFEIYSKQLTGLYVVKLLIATCQTPGEREREPENEWRKKRCVGEWEWELSVERQGTSLAKKLYFYTSSLELWQSMPQSFLVICWVIFSLVVVIVVHTLHVCSVRMRMNEYGFVQCEKLNWTIKTPFWTTAAETFSKWKIATKWFLLWCKC